MSEAEEAKVKVRSCCAKCQSDNPKMVCGRCSTRYCSAACQRAHWPVHKPRCRDLLRVKEEMEEMKAQLKDREGDVNLRLIWAAELGQLAECERMIAEERPDLNWCSTTGLTENCLYTAACGGHARVVALLLRHGARSDVYNYQGATPLTIAAVKGHELVVKTLIEHGVEIDLPTRCESGSAALCLAAQGGHASIVALLLNAGAVADRTRFDGATALVVASQQGHAEVVRLLLRAGANPLHRANNGATPLQLATHHDHFAVVELLQARIAEIERAH